MWENCGEKYQSDVQEQPWKLKLVKKEQRGFVGLRVKGKGF